MNGKEMPVEIHFDCIDEKLIQPIGRDSVHRICSGQVVLSLAIAVKELVENSIDAGATRIDIRLKEYGSDLIEVLDNGDGVCEANFQALTLKHYTSKIKQFSDLESVTTLGFRGEALSSLCALSDLTITTRYKSANAGTKIIYDRHGKIISETVTAREQGTTVTLENLFSSLPVRRKEFLKNMKREFSKMCNLIYAYCLVSRGIKFNCVNITKHGSKNTVVATEGHQSIKENIISIFGAKQISSLIEVELIRPDDQILNEFSIKLVPGEDILFTFVFLISSVTHGSGRSTTDRQFYFINSRPCVPSKVIKLVNEIYKQFNSGQFPFVFLNIITRNSLVDVNVTPDKRQIFVEKENLLLATIKSSLLEVFKTFPSTFKVQNGDISKSFLITVTDGNKRGLKRAINDASIKKGSILEAFKKRAKSEDCKMSDSKEFVQINTKTEEDCNENLNNLFNLASEMTRNDEHDITCMEEVLTCKLGSVKTSSNKQKEEISTSINFAGKTYQTEFEYTKQKLEESIVSRENLTSFDLPNIEVDKLFDEDIEISIDSPVVNTPNKKSMKLNTSIENIKQRLENQRLNNIGRKNIKIKFRSVIAPNTNQQAEEELQKQIVKTDFENMKIIGQFNLGFIITKLNNDLFIIDQHATDEKYNFEQLQITTAIESQILVNPKPLELSAGNEVILMENEEIFKKNGFAFRLDETAPCTKKVFLTAVPLSKNWVFGKDDIDEMLVMLKDSNNKMCRPSRVRAMFASRACRKSVMIGKSLSKNDMKKLINHMGEIEQPWNCPHGRPTMRHLINLDLITKSSLR